MTSSLTELQREVAALLVESLNLDISAEAIDPQAPLYGEGLGLDSIDILEVALVVSQRYGFQLRSDDQDNVRIFTSLASLTEHIAANRVGIADGGFESDDNALTVYGHGFERQFAQAPKTRLAEALLDLIAERLATTP